MMKRYRIHTPMPGHTEVIGTVAFSHGVAECEAEPMAAPLMYFRAAGYRIEEQDEHGEWVPETPPVRRKGPDPVAVLQAENDALRAQLAKAPDATEPSADASEVEPAPKPAGNASTETWRAWAVQHGGLSQDEAETMSRDQLAERFASEEKS